MIYIKGLTYTYGDQPAINDLNIQLNDGMIGLLGENGAGKTTLMKLMATLKTIQEGSININGIEIKNKNYYEIRKLVGFMPQEFGFYSHFTVRQMLEYMCLLENMKKDLIMDKIRTLLKKLNLIRQIDKKTKELSGGMKRRLGLACAIINDPEMLIVDEPTVGLDPEERIKMRNFLKKYSMKKTVLLSTHIVEDISSICEDVVILSRGNLLFNGKARNLIKESPETYVIECLADKVDEYREKGTITDISYTTDNRCVIKVVSQQPDFEYSKITDKNLETAYMHLLDKKGV